MTRTRRLGTVVVVALAAGVVLQASGSGSLAPPPTQSWAALEQWYAAAGPGTAVVALVRLAAVIAATWLVIAGGLQMVAALGHGARLQRLADAISPRVLRSLAQGAAGLSMTAGLVVPSPVVGASGEPPGTAVMVPLDVTPATATPDDSTTTTTTVPPAPTPPATPVPIPVPNPPAPAADEVVVAPGDSFWSIAVDEAAGRDVVTYWRALIDANRDRLVDSSNPDLLYPDQVLRLP